ncbi:MAG: hypothetical protein NPIRA02_05740 [Nitrospirales bacterium]|nr:MAG: hypothetical protein NPIRA02_05740 [Nitrospirales bacterium]
MKTRMWFMVPLILGVLFGCTEKQLGQISHLVNTHVTEKQPGGNSNLEKAHVVTQGTHTTFSNSVAQEIAALDDYFSTLQYSIQASGTSLSKKDQKTMKSAKTVSQKGKTLQKKGNSYHALQKVRTAKRMMKPMMKKLWTLGDKRAILGLVNQQIGVVKQRHRELEDLVALSKVKSRKAINAQHRSKELVNEANMLRKNGKLRRAYVQSEEALKALDMAIAVVWRDRNSVTKSQPTRR